jgi:NADH-ubiquinone oxidoreductase chain 5
MVFACGVSNYAVGVFHLANHAFFKALLFLSAGSVIHGVSDEQDMRKMGGLRRLLPFTYAMMLIGSLSLMGMPFLTGFYSKDVILEVAYAKYTIPGHFAYWLGTFAAFFTAFYSMRLAFLTFLSEPNGYRPIITNAHDSPIRMALPLAILAVPSIFIGFIARDMIIGLGSDFWSNAIFVHPRNLNSIDAEFIPHSMKLLPVGLSITGAASACILYSYKSNLLYSFKISEVGRKLYTFLNRKWFFDKVYNEYIAQNMLFFGYHISYKTIDRGIIEIFGPMGLSSAVTKKANLMRELQTGYIYHYAFFIFLGTGVLISLSFLDSSVLSFIDYRIICLLVATAFASKQIRTVL